MSVANIMKSLAGPKQYKPSPRVGNGAPKQRAEVRELAYKPHNMSDMRWQALEENARHNRNRRHRLYLAYQERRRVEYENARRRARAAEHIQRVWRAWKGYTYAPDVPRRFVASDSESSDSDSDSSVSDDFF